MNSNKIIIKGAKENNLKNIDLEIPRDKLIVMTGLSGSGKSSLAFDTIYADGQRRYVESLSSYARQFLGQMEKPNVESIEGLSPAISIDQKTTSKNPRSTVGTVTEIYDYLRLLYARIGIPHCPICNKEIKQQSIDQMVDSVLEIEKGSRIQILAPVVKGQKGTHVKELDAAKRQGFVRVRVNGIIYDLEEDIILEKNKKHSIEIVIDRLVIEDDMQTRLASSLETALSLTNGTVLIDVVDKEELMFSQNFACPDHSHISIDELQPRMFSFNNPFGACEKCTGLGIFMRVDPELVIPNKRLSIDEGGIKASGWYYAEGALSQMYYRGLSKKYGFSLSTPIKDLPQKVIDIILYGTNGEKVEYLRESDRGMSKFTAEFEGVINNLERRFRETNSSWMKEEISSIMSGVDCPDCHGDRLKPIILAVTVGDMNISNLTKLSIRDALNFIKGLKLSNKDVLIADSILKEVGERLSFLQSVGLEYLTLARSAGSLSGGESQRIRLATQIGSSLMGVLYVLDEPSIGLHQRDNEKLIATLKHLRDIGNTLIVVEHDEDTIREADFIVDIGPGAGIHGGEVIAQGTLEDIQNCKESITGQYLSGKKTIEVPKKLREGNGHTIKILGAKQNNLKNIDVEFPLGKFICITGVSGSGKSSLINEILYKKAMIAINGSKIKSGAHDDIQGFENIDKVIGIDQSAIGRTPRSNPATYTGVFTDIRNLFSQTNEAKMRGYQPGRFSFNVKGGRCEACEGDGIIQIEMHFLPDIYVPCEVCKGKRYNRETLEVKYKDKTIADVLDMTVESALSFFENIPKIYRKIKTLYDVGLGYIKLGQSATTLSGGEAQRVKLALELSKNQTGKTLYILDEPTTGLHTADVHRLIEVLQKLCDAGNTIIVIEHNLDLIKVSDHIIDIGPEGGDEGGKIVAQGTPKEITKVKKSYTGAFLKDYLK